MSHPQSSNGDTSLHARTLASQIIALTDLNVAKCYQCGKCSAGCPMSGEMALRPHDLMRLAGTNRLDRIASDESIWLCLTCETCTARCPNGCDPARVIDAIREIVAGLDPKASPVRLRAFHKSFLEQVRHSGRMFELGLMIAYKMRTGTFTADVQNAPGMLSRGKLKLTHRKIRGIREVRRVFDACLKEEEER